MTDNPDRTVHAEMRTLDGDFAEVVRYARGGKWWLESRGYESSFVTGKIGKAPERKPLSLSQAVALSLQAQKSEAGAWFPGRPGGRTLDSRVFRALDTRKKGKR